MNISPAGSRPSVRRQTSRLFVLIIEQPPTAHLNSLSRSSRGSFPPLLGMSHFYDHHFGSHRPSPSTVKPSLASKSAALIKIASFVALSIPLSSYPWWHNGAGNFPLQSWFRRTSTWNNGGVLLYDELARWVSSISFYLLIFFLWPDFLSKGKLERSGAEATSIRRVKIIEMWNMQQKSMKQNQHGVLFQSEQAFRAFKVSLSWGNNDFWSQINETHSSRFPTILLRDWLCCHWLADLSPESIVGSQ